MEQKIKRILVCGKTDHVSDEFAEAERTLMESIVAVHKTDMDDDVKITTMRGRVLPDRNSQAAIEGMVWGLQEKLGLRGLGFQTEFREQDGYSFMVVYLGEQMGIAESNDLFFKKWPDKMKCDYCKLEKESGASFEAATLGYSPSKIYICKECIISKTDKENKKYRISGYVGLVLCIILAGVLTGTLIVLLKDIIAGNTDKFAGGVISNWFAIPVILFFVFSAFLWYCAFLFYSILRGKAWAIKRGKSPIPTYKSISERMAIELCIRNDKSERNNTYSLSIKRSHYSR
jgi:hypothetical protein